MNVIKCIFVEFKQAQYIGVAKIGLKLSRPGHISNLAVDPKNWTMC